MGLRIVILLIISSVLLVSLPAHANVPNGSNTLVSTFQAALTLLGYDSGPIDGILGPQTKTALRHYQTDSGLEITGSPNRETLLAIRDDLAVFEAIESLKGVGERLTDDPVPTAEEVSRQR